MALLTRPHLAPRALGGQPCTLRVSSVRTRSTRRAALDSAAEAPVAIYAGLGASATAFLATFFVAPLFKTSFKEEEPWEMVFDSLSQQGVQSLTPLEASKRRGAVLLDVRLAEAANQLCVPAAVQVPLYQPIARFDAASIIRRAAFAFFAIAGTERNPEFLAQVARRVPNKGAELLCLCESGGSLETRAGVAKGFQSRSLKSVFLLRQAGYRNVKHVQGGTRAWQKAGLPMVEQ